MGNSSRPDFNVLEVAGVRKDKQELIMVLKDMADHLPKEDPSKGNSWNYLLLKKNTPHMLRMHLTRITFYFSHGRVDQPRP